MIDIEELIEIHNKEDNQTSGETWKALRQAILERDNYTCQECEAKATTVHHTSYGYVDASDLVSVCPQCHMRLHNLNPELMGLEKRAICDLERTITILEARIKEGEGNLNGFIKGHIYPYAYYRPNKESMKSYIGYQQSKLRDMEQGLEELKVEYENKTGKL